MAKDENPKEDEPNEKEELEAKRKKKKTFVIITLVFLLSAIVVFCWWFFWARFEASTQDAYVHGNQVMLTPQIPGIVTAVNINETELVEEGQVLIRLDETDRQIDLDSAINHLGDTVRQVTKMFENVYSLAAQFEVRQAELFSAEVDYVDRKSVVAEGAVSDEDYIHSESNFYAAKASVEVVKFQLMQAISLVQKTTIVTHPLVEKAKERVKQTWVNLQRCTIKAPVAGVVALRTVQVGESVMVTTPLLAIVPLDQMWVNANFKEDDLSGIRIGQPVNMTADTYGGQIVYKGEVIGIAAGSGAVFSPLPPQNATGNWIKIVQRIPVRVSINSEQLRRFPLRLGLSMDVHVDIRDKEGRRVPHKSVEKPLYVTDVFINQIDGSEQLIEEILEKNMTFDMCISHEVLSLVGK